MTRVYDRPDSAGAVQIEETGPDIVAVYPASFAQRRLWFLDQFEPDSSAYNSSLALRLSGALDLNVMRRALGEIVRRHESLRTVLHSEGGSPVQAVRRFEGLRLPLADVSSSDSPEREAARLAAREAEQPFNLARGFLFRPYLFRLSEREHVLLLTAHHIISDAWSRAVLLRELGALYTAFSEGGPSPLDELPIQYGDYAIWQIEWLQGQQRRDLEGFWLEQMQGVPLVLDLQADRPQPRVRSERGASFHFQLSETLSAGVVELSRATGVTPFMTLLAALEVVVGRRGGVEEFIVGTAAAGRTHPDVEGLIGFFVNTLPLRAVCRPEWSFTELLRQVRRRALDAYTHQDLPFDQIVEKLQPDRTLNRSPVVQLMFLLGGDHSATLKLPGVSVSAFPLGQRTTTFDLVLSMTDERGRFSGTWLYSEDLFERATIQRLAANFRTVLQAAIQSPGSRIGQLPLLDGTERRLVLRDWQAPGAPLPTVQTIHTLFDQQAVITPHALAVVQGDVRLTYAELARLSNQLAHFLQRRGIGEGKLVQLCLDSSVDAIVGLLGILKAGAAYVPIDPTLPGERLGQLRSLLGDQPVLTNSKFHPQVEAWLTADAICIDRHWETILGELHTPPECNATPDDLAYGILTSGSTGTPKAVLISHANLIGSTAARLSYYEGPAPSALLVAPLFFDSSVGVIFGTLCRGGTLTVPDDMARNEPWQIAEHLSGEISELLCTPTLYGAVIRELPRIGPKSLQRIIVAGEPLDPGLVERHFGLLPTVPMYNEYGPTEATVWTTVQKQVQGSADDRVSIGRPIPNTRVYVLDGQLEPMPIGVAGELYIGGAGVARGYLGQPALTAERFVPDPFSGLAGARLYRTGDRVRWRADGTLEFLGRLDHQVKLRGYRIEPGEVEATLREHRGVQEAAVVVREERGEKQLVGYVVPRAGQALEPGELRNYLAARLPAYMVPGAFVLLERLPLSTNGKLDRGALPVPSAQPAGGEYRRPRTPTEKLLAGIWADVLRLERVGVEDNFFQLGGHSLLATQVISRVRQELAIDLSVRSLFEAPTVEEFAGRITAQAEGGGAASAAAPIPVSAVPSQFPMSFPQRRFWFLARYDASWSNHAIQDVVRISGPLNVLALQLSVGEIIRRHQILRTVFEDSLEEAVQRVLPPPKVPLPPADLSLLPPGEQEAQLRGRSCGATSQPFDLARGPLARGELLRLAADEHVFVWTMHHIISDGWSRTIFFRELAQLYDAYARGYSSPLPDLPLQYGDFSAWQRQRASGPGLAGELDYWRHQLEDAPAALMLPTDHPRPAEETHHGAVHQFRIPADLANRIQELSRREQATPFMVVLAGLAVLLQRYTGQTDLVIGCPIAGRLRPELEQLIGPFLNMLPLRLDLGGAPTFRELLSRTREVTLSAYEHQELPFERLLEELRPGRSASSNPLFQVMFAYQNVPELEVSLSGLVLTPVEGEGTLAKADLSLFMMQSGDGLAAILEYNTDLFNHDRIVRLGTHLERVLEGATSDPDRPISEVPLLSASELQWILHDRNDTAVSYPHDQCLDQLFETQAAAAPAAVAVAAGDRLFTYGELNERSDALAWNLRDRGVGPERIVAVCLERGIDMIVAMLGVLKAGGAYVPLDPSYPTERLAYMLSDTEASVVLTQSHLTEKLPWPEERMLCMDTSPWTNLRRPGRPPRTTSAGNLAYVMYTSGTTGRPKGAAITHRAICRLLFNTNYISLNASDRVAQASNASFDATTFEVWGALLHGARLVIMERNPVLEPEAFSSQLRHTGVSVLFLPTAVLNHLARNAPSALNSVRDVLFAGEAADPRSTAAFRAAGYSGRLLNMYGPTECTAFATWQPVSPVEELLQTIPIGRPISNTQVYVLGRELQPVPVGVSGELYIGGPGVAREFFRRPALSADRLLPDPFAAEPGARMYRTGDLVRYRPDGLIDFYGRIDRQVKVRGFRIELDEIEEVLRRHPLVEQTAVEVIQRADGEAGLAAYVTPRSGGPRPHEADLRDDLKSQLPEYMVPSSIVVLDEFPLTPNGKIDRNALPLARNRMPPAGAETDAGDHLESELTAIWAGLLGRTSVEKTDNFFDLGGHSFLAVRLLAQLESRFGVQLPLISVFRAPTPESMARLLHEHSQEEPARTLVPLRPEGTRAALFCVHNIGGEVHPYVILAKYLKDRPLYGLRARGLNGEGAPLDRIETQASAYVRAIRECRPSGPYLVAGWSSGGVVAYEMAQQLTSAGLAPAAVVMFDTRGVAPHDVLDHRAPILRMLAGVLPAGFEQALSQVDPGDQVGFALERLEACANAPAHLLNWLRVYRANAETLKHYRPRPYSGRVLVLQAIDEPPRGPLEPIRFWSELVGAHLESIRIHGRHGTIFEPPHVDALGSELERFLGELP